MSLSTLKRRLNFLGLKRKNVEEAPLQEITEAVFSELQSAGYNLGYRAL